LWKENIDSS